MICFFTYSSRGGMLQLSVQLLLSALRSGREAVLLAPEDRVAYYGDEYADHVISYAKGSRRFLTESALASVEALLSGVAPKMVVFVSPSIAALQIAKRLGPSVSMCCLLHDARPHSTYSVRRFVSARFGLLVRRRLFSLVDRIVVLSENTRSELLKSNPEHQGKVIVVPLGAHAIAAGTMQVPPEIDGDTGQFVLFFGRLDKQKGIGTLLSAARSFDDHIKTVIAGNGVLSSLERRLLGECRNVTLINRYILDQEMEWLFRHCGVVVLPYRDATQSGVLPIAYFFGRPVVASDIPGIREFVDDGVTGYLCGSKEDFAFRVNELFGDRCALSRMGDAARCYYERRLDWNVSINALLDGA